MRKHPALCLVYHWCSANRGSSHIAIIIHEVFSRGFQWMSCGEHSPPLLLPVLVHFPLLMTQYHTDSVSYEERGFNLVHGSSGTRSRATSGLCPGRVPGGAEDHMVRGRECVCVCVCPSVHPSSYKATQVQSWGLQSNDLI